MLSINEQIFHNTFTHLGTGLALVSPQGRWLDVNPAFCKLVGYEHDELLSLTFQDITHSDDLANDIEHLNRLLDGKEEVYQVEKRYYHKSGKIVWILLIVSIVKDSADLPVFFITQIQDITQRRNFEIALVKQNEHLNILTLHLTQQNLKLEELNQIVSHNLRTPAGNIQMLLNFFAEATDEEEKRELKKQLDISSENLMDILNDLVDLIKVKDLKNISKEWIGFKDVLDKTTQMMYGAIFQKEVNVDYDFKISEIFYSKIYLESIILNFVSNAIKYCSNKRTPSLNLKTFLISGDVILEVSDNGIGIDLEKHQDQIFQLNKTFHDHPDAKGLGLYMVKSHIESLGGEISIQSKPDSGTTFRVNFGKLKYR